MQYDRYHGKVKKVAAFLGKMYAHLTLIIIALVALTVIVTAMVATKGLIVTESDCPAEVVYGEKLGYRVGVVLSHTTYEYRRQGEEVWTTEKPVIPGDYQVRAMGKTSFGKRNYTEIHDFTILPREITPTVADTRITYGETPRVKADLAKGDTLHCEIKYESLTPSTVAWVNRSSIVITDEDGNNRTACYTITDIPQVAVRITPRPITVTVQNASKVYDAMRLSFDGYEISKGTLLAGDNLVAVFNTSITDAGSIVNQPTLRIFNTKGEEVTGLYDMTVRAGTLTVEQRPLIIRTGSVSYIYTGREMRHREYELDPTTSLVSGHYLEIKSAPTLIDCGSVENTLTFTVRNRSGSDVSRNYSVFVEAGTLRIAQREVFVRTDSTTLVYDGTDQSYPHVTVENGTSDSYRADDAATIRDVGSVENRMTVRFFRGTQDVTANYKITGYAYGTITVTPRPITVQINDVEKPYDGTPLTSTACHVNAYQGYTLPKGHTVTLQTKGSTVFGKAANRYVAGSVRVHDENKRDVTANYLIGVEDGTLNVTPRPLTVTVPGATKVYDGTPLSKPEWGITKGSLLQNHVLSVTPAGTSITDVGSVTNEVNTALTRVYDSTTNEDVTKYYDITYDLGELRITPRYITLETRSGEWMYDGTVHEGNPELFLTAGSLLAGHTLERASAPVTIRNAGSTNNTVYARIMNDEWDVTHNYSIQYNFGKLTVTKRPITVRISSATWTYDGQPHTQPGVTVSDTSEYGLVLDHQLRVKDTNQLFFTECGDYVNNPAVDVYSPSTGTYVSGNYKISREMGTVTIQKRPLTIQINGEKIYDGLPMTNWRVDFTKDTSLAAGHTVVAMPVEVPTNASTMASVLNTDTFDVRDANGNSVIKNYSVSWQKGSLTVQRRPVSLMTATAEKVYDGLPLTDYTLELAPDSLPLVEGDKVLMVVNGRGTEIGQYQNTCYPETFTVSSNGLDVTHNYELVSVTEGTLTVKCDAVITVTTGSAVKPFDGLPLYCDEYTVEITEGTFPEGYTVYVDVTGSITQPGSTANSVTVAVWNAEGQDVTALVTLKLRPGVLTVQENNQDDGTVFGRVMADRNGLLYLRMASYGDYNGQGWNTAIPYSGTLTGGYSLNYLPAAALKALGLSTKSTVQFSDMRIFMLPYYMEIGGSAPVVGTDTVYANTQKTNYTATFYPVTNGTELVEMYYNAPSFLKPYLLGSYASAERTYRTFVHDQYLTLDSETRAFMEQIIAEQGFSASDRSVIADVAAYIRNVAIYNLNYDPAMDSVPNVAIAFLRDYKEGVCVHYATAATLLYRTLGIPARYVTGFAQEVKAGEWVEIKSPGHAWVEVYVDGLGWIQVEVTGSSGGSNPPDTPVTPPVSQKPALELIPAFAHKVYDGTYLYSPNELVMTPTLEALLNLGYTYTVRTSGAQKDVGDGESYVTEFILYDPNGNNVTDNFRLVKKNGLLRVTGTAVEVFLYPLIKTADGRPAVWGEGDYTVLTLPSGLTLTLTVTLPADKLGYVTLSDLNRNLNSYVTYRLTDGDRDVTADYPLVFTLPAGTEDAPILTVRARSIEVTAASETRVYEGEPLSNPDIYISKGSLITGHTLVAAATGTCTSVGSVANIVAAVKVLDAEGSDVTDLYSITRVEGTLTLLAPESE